METAYVCIIKTSEGLWLQLADRGKCILGYKTESEGVRSWEDGYRDAHRRSYEGSMSACIAFIQAQPSIVRVDDLNVLAELMVDRKCYAVNSVAIHFHGAKLKPEAEKLWKAGVQPRLI